MAPKLAAVAAAKPATTKAFVTFLAGDGDYWMSVVGLAKRVRKAGSAYPLVVAVLPDVPESHRRILVSQGCIVREIIPVYLPENQTQFTMAYSKLRIWEFVEYDRMVYLDADTQVFDNIDELFDLPKGHFYAVMDCSCEKTWSHNPQYQIGYCQQCPVRVAWPAAEMGPPPALYFNAGMLVHEPSMTTAKALLDTLRVSLTTPFVEQKPNRAANIHKRIVNDEHEFTRSTSVVLNDDNGSMRDLEAAQSFLPPSASKEQLVRGMWMVSRASLFVGVSAGIHQPADHQATYYGVVAAILAAVPVEMATAFCLHRSNNPRFHSFAEGLQCVGIVLLIIACAVGGFELTLKA